MRRYILKSTLVLILLPFTMNAQTATPQEPRLLSLEDAKNYAVKNNATARNARLDVLIQKAKNAEITGLAIPNLSSQGQFVDYLNPMKSFVPGEFIGQPGKFVPVQFTPKYSVSASGTASQILFDGSVMVALQAKKAILKIYDENAKLTEEDVRYNVQKAYYGLVIVHKQFDILKEVIGKARKITKDAHVVYETGFTEKIDVDRADVALNNFVADSIRIGGLVTLTEQLLKFSMGMDIDQAIVLTDTSSAQTMADAGLLSQPKDYNSRTEYSMLQTQLKLNQYDLKRHRLSGLPSLATFISAGYNFATNSYDDLWYMNQYYQFNSYWGLNLRLPLFDGGQRFNRVKQAKINVEKTNNSIENLKLAIDFQVEQSRTSYKNSLLAMENQKRNLDLANSVLDLSDKKYKAGVGSNIELTLAQTDMLQAQTNYFNAMLDVVNAKSDLQKALGQFK
jgi:outer membrane protein